MEAERIKIIIAAHKKYRMPEDPVYLPLHVGAEGKKDVSGQSIDFGYVKDNTGDHISSRNPCFCELTGLYWAWKNLECDYLGLVHYRRYFSYKKAGSDPFDSILTGKQAAELLEKYRVLVPKKRKYYIETLNSHYIHTHDSGHLGVVKDIITQRHPEYLDSLQEVLDQTWGYMFNMMIMPKSLVEDYCCWLFDILFELERKIEVTKQENYSSFDARLYGRVSEILFNVWLRQKQKDGILTSTDIRELPVIYMERIDWGRKIMSFLMAKFFHKRYHKSF